MYPYVAARVNNCVNCLAKKTSQGKPTHTQHREQLSYFGQRVYADTVGPLTPHLHDGKMCRHFLTIQDGFSRYLVCVPIPSTETEVLVDALITKWIQVFGVFEVLHTDRGTSFTSQLFSEVMKRLGIVKTVTPPYNPQGNRVERTHKILGQLLRADRKFEARAWPEKLAVACFAYNTAQNRVIGMSPYEVVFGRPPNLPLGIIFPFKEKEGTSFSNYVENLKLRYSRIFAKVAETQNGVLLTDLARDQARAAPAFAVGDTCYYFLGRVPKGLSKKLASRYLGPFEVIRVVSEALVVIYPKGTWSKNAREIATSVRRLHKVDPEQSRAVLHPSSRHQIDLDVVLDDFSVSIPEAVVYQDDFDEEVIDTGTAPVPIWNPVLLTSPEASAPSDPSPAEEATPADAPVAEDAPREESASPPVGREIEAEDQTEVLPRDRPESTEAEAPAPPLSESGVSRTSRDSSVPQQRPPIRQSAMQAMSKISQDIHRGRRGRKHK